VGFALSWVLPYEPSPNKRHHRRHHPSQKEPLDIGHMLFSYPTDLSNIEYISVEQTICFRRVLTTVASVTNAHGMLASLVGGKRDRVPSLRFPLSLHPFVSNTRMKEKLAAFRRRLRPRLLSKKGLSSGHVEFSRTARDSSSSRRRLYWTSQRAFDQE
jgi:hypothetical protein